MPVEWAVKARWVDHIGGRGAGGVDRRVEFVVGMLWFGYPKITPEQARKNVAEVLTELP